MFRIVALILALHGLTASALVMTANNPQDFADQAADVRRMMEAVRHRSDGTAPEATPMRKADVGKADSMSNNFEASLMEQADRITSSMLEDQKYASSKRTVLAAQGQAKGSQKDRAARFFATHNMKKIASILGDSLSKNEEEQAMRDAAAAQKSLENKVAAKAVAPAKLASSDMSDILAADEDSSYKNQWKAVDELQRRRPSFA
mmetsp:Transcript_47257/g.86775  ORF Transcript_47257/g.86775 Transcript_47257/m.86775 type:complete len:204 (+) Transcript_47257:60-671(+)